VLDVAGVSAYSVYPLYNPFRLVIDCVRSPGLAAAVDPAAKARTPPEVQRAAPLAARPAAPAALPPLDIARPVPEVARPAPERAPEPAAPRAVAAKPPPSLTAKRLATTSMRTMPSMSSRHATVLTELHAIDNLLGIGPNGTAAAPLSAETTLPAKSITGAAPPVPSLPARNADIPKPGASRASADNAAATPRPGAEGAAATAPKPDLPSRNLNGGLSIARQLGLGISRIVIDPGHGGHDPGATGKGVSESELVLDVALRLEQLLLRGRAINRARRGYSSGLGNHTQARHRSRASLSRPSRAAQKRHYSAAIAAMRNWSLALFSARAARTDSISAKSSAYSRSIRRRWRTLSSSVARGARLSQGSGPMSCGAR